MEAPSQKSHNKTKAGRGSKEKKKSKLSAAKGEQVKRHNVKTRRVTFVECPNTTTGMLDCAKVADLVLLCVDAKFGFEMEVRRGKRQED